MRDPSFWSELAEAAALVILFLSLLGGAIAIAVAATSG